MSSNLRLKSCTLLGGALQVCLVLTHVVAVQSCELRAAVLWFAVAPECLVCDSSEEYSIILRTNIQYIEILMQSCWK
jgi:hypothetical protein